MEASIAAIDLGIYVANQLESPPPTSCTLDIRM